MWYYEEDNTCPVITAERHAASSHGFREGAFRLLETAVVFDMSGFERVSGDYETACISGRFPRFLDGCPIYRIRKNGKEICALHGGWGAPMAADTVETLRALGVKNVISAGMIGGFSPEVQTGDLLVPPFALCEEGTSRHYAAEPQRAEPDEVLRQGLLTFVKGCRSLPIVTTDAVYRQTYYKEALWRSRGAVGVDMETSAIFTVSRCLGMRAAALLMVSDVHPVEEGAPAWRWEITPDMRKRAICGAIDFALTLE